MFETLVITLREGVEAALVLAIALAFLHRRGERGLARALWAGAAVALVLSVAAAWLAQRLTWNEELAEGIAMLVGAALVGSLAFWMWRAGPRMKAAVEGGMTRAADRPPAGRAFAVFLFALGMVFREGMETAIFLSATTFNSDGLQRLFGAMIGLTLALAFGVLFARGSVRVSLKPFFAVTTAVLVLLALQLVVGGLHELSEAQVLPSSQAEMALVGPIVRSELLVFAFTLALVVAWLMLQRAAVPVPAGAAANEGPEARLRRAAIERERRRRAWTAAVGLATLTLFATAFVQQSRVPPRPPAQELVASERTLSFPASLLEDGRAHFFAAALHGQSVRFFAVRVGGQVKTCLDACEICGDQGYFEEGSQLVCRNCTSPIVAMSLGRQGGCNPIPLPSREAGGRIEIRLEEVEAAAGVASGHHH